MSQMGWRTFQELPLTDLVKTPWSWSVWVNPRSLPWPASSQAASFRGCAFMDFQMQLVRLCQVRGSGGIAGAGCAQAPSPLISSLCLHTTGCAAQAIYEHSPTPGACAASWGKMSRDFKIFLIDCANWTLKMSEVTLTLKVLDKIIGIFFFWRKVQITEGIWCAQVKALFLTWTKRGQV